MRKFLLGLLLGLSVLQVSSCKMTLEAFFKPVLKPVMNVLTNQELTALQLALQISKKSKGHWPTNLPELFANIENDSLRVILRKFEFLEWNQEGDSLLVTYRLNYAETDSTTLNFLAGKFYLQPNLDTLRSRHFQIEGETKEGLQIFSTELKMQIEPRETKDE